MRLVKNTLASAFAAVLAGTLSAQEIIDFRIGTGGPGGNYLLIGEAIANAVSPIAGRELCNADGDCERVSIRAVPLVTAASVYNNSSIQSGELDAGLATADVLRTMYFGEGEFEGNPHPKLRILASLYLSQLHLVLPERVAISDVGDLAGMRVGIAEPGSGTQVTVLHLLELWDVARDDIAESELNMSESAAQYLDGQLDAFFYVVAWPAEAMRRIADIQELNLHSFDKDELDLILADLPTLVSSVIPADAYDGLQHDAHVPGVTSYLVVSSEVSEDIVYEVAKNLWRPSARNILDNSHSKGRFITLATALDGVDSLGIPLHVGAAKYYREAGMID